MTEDKIAKRDPFLKRLNGPVFIGLSLLIHLIIFVAAPFFMTKDEPKEMLVVEFTPVTKAVREPQLTPAPQPRPTQPPQPAVQPPRPTPAPTPAPQPTPRPAPPAPAPEPTPAPVETPTETVPEQTVDKPEPTTDAAPVAVVPVPTDLPEYEGEAPIATAPDSSAASPESSVPREPESAETAEDGDPQTDTTLGTVSDPEGTSSDSEGSPDTADEPETAPEPIELDGRVEVPTVQTFVSDRIQGQIEFTGQGRRLISTPSAPDFALTGNTNVTITFKIDRNGRPYDVRVPPLGSEIEQVLRNFASGMRFSAVLYNEPDTATMRVTLTVR